MGIVIRALANTFQIRSGAQNFANGANVIQHNMQKIAQINSNLTSGPTGWHGKGAESFTEQMELFGEDLQTSMQACERTASGLFGLATQLDQVNSLRQQVEQLRNEIRSLESRAWSADDAQRSAIQQEISTLNYRASSMESEADSLEYRANALASSMFDDIAALVNRLHVFELGEGAKSGEGEGAEEQLGAKELFEKTGTAFEVVEKVNDTDEVIRRYREGFGVKVVRRRIGKYAEVTNGKVEGIQGRRYYFSNAEYYEQVMKYVNGKTAAFEAVKDFKSVGGALGYASIAIETGADLYEDIKDNESVSKTVADATVDIGIGVGSIAASAWAGAVVGAEIGTFGGPLGTLVGGLVGIAIGATISYVSSIHTADGKTLKDHIKDGLKDVIDDGTSLAKSAIGTVCHLFD